ncbi:MAG TPA: PmoA family protein [Opitutaceae bacterium]|nr:PmoA family protein [Opitutaceae bacterium]
MKPRGLPLVLGLLLAAGGTLRAADQVALTRLSDRVRVTVDGRLFTEFVFTGASRPYCYPILAADGTSLTRDFPMKRTPGEDTDHPWHKALYFEHSYLNGVDFWNESGGDRGRSPQEKGNTVTDRIEEATSGAVGVLRVHDRYVAPDGRLICTDERTLRFHGDGDARFIDYEVTLQALPAAPLHIGDNKDGTMAIRLPQWMTMPHKFKGTPTGGDGHIVTANGYRDGAAWGKRADWCDYHAEHQGKVYGVAIFDHPQNLRHPTWWMARDYGLFGANPFGWHDFEPKTTQPHAGDVTVPPGGSLTLRYRFYFHTGDEKSAHVADEYARYAEGK